MYLFTIFPFYILVNLFLEVFAGVWYNYCVF